MLLFNANLTSQTGPQAFANGTSQPWISGYIVPAAAAAPGPAPASSTTASGYSDGNNSSPSGGSSSSSGSSGSGSAQGGRRFLLENFGGWKLGNVGQHGRLESDLGNLEWAL